MENYLDRSSLHSFERCAQEFRVVSVFARGGMTLSILVQAECRAFRIHRGGTLYLFKYWLQC